VLMMSAVSNREVFGMQKVSILPEGVPVRPARELFKPVSSGKWVTTNPVKGILVITDTYRLWSGRYAAGRIVWSPVGVGDEADHAKIVDAYYAQLTVPVGTRFSFPCDSDEVIVAAGIVPPTLQ